MSDPITLGLSRPDAGPLAKSGEKFAKEAATTIAVEADKPLGQPGEVTVGVSTSHEGERVSWSVGAWFKRKFMPGGTSAGVKGEIKF